MKPSTSVYPTMESLELPRELLWDGKTEPASPSVTSELFPLSESIDASHLFYDDNFVNEIIYINDNDVKILELISADETVVALNGLVAEPWNDAGKLQLSPPEYASVQPNLLPLVKAQSGIFEQSSAFDTELAIIAQDTPPHSPPAQHIGSPAYLASNSPASSPASFKEEFIQISPTTLLNINDNNNVPTPLHSNATSAASSVAASPAPLLNEQQQLPPYSIWANSQAEVFGTLIANIDDEITRENQIVDEIVRTRAQELELESRASYTDEDWLPSSSSYSSSASSICSASSSPTHFHSAEEQFQAPVTAALAAATTVKPTANKRRARPYARGVEDRKIRKKEQNKNAATRYRQKKKQEMEIVQTEEQQLNKLNEQLKRTYADCLHEEKYLKKLIREFYGKKR